MLATAPQFTLLPANDNAIHAPCPMVATGTVVAMGRAYAYQRLGVGRYRLARGMGRGRVEVGLTGRDERMRGTGDGLGFLSFAVRDGRLEVWK